MPGRSHFPVHRELPADFLSASMAMQPQRPIEIPENAERICCRFAMAVESEEERKTGWAHEIRHRRRRLRGWKDCVKPLRVRDI